jgi:PAS domain S-box-containing protein
MKKNTQSKISNPQSLRVLIIEDSEDDALLIIRDLKKGGYNPVYERVETAAAMKKALQEKQWDIILCDYKLPKFNAPSAIEVLKKANIDIPLIIVSGVIGEDVAIECMRLGAQDYIMKGNLSRLCPVIARELKEAEVKNRQRQIESQREIALEALRQSEEKHRTILENIEDGYYETDLAGNFTFFNDSMCRIHGYSKEELMGMNNRQYEDKESLKKVFQAYNKVYKTGKPLKEFDRQITRKDGTKRHIEVSVSLIKDSSDKPIGFRGITRDITEHKKAEELIRQSEAKYRMLADHMKDPVWLMDLDLKWLYISPSVEKLVEYTLEELQQIPLDKFLTEKSFQEAMEFFPVQFSAALQNPSEYLTPLLNIECHCKNGSTLWIETAFSFILDENGNPVSILGEGRDITERRRLDAELLLTLESLRKSFGTTIKIMVSAVEARDPYTAGHQIRSADLARSIATEMGLPQDKIDGIRMAGSIHDIGKLSIPAEILSKPTKLTNLEFSLIKEHSRSGYDMLKNMESPWQLAEIVYQHHERMNGSGYPRNLKGDKILIEARIMAVADVVESMASNRPYRPSLGIEAALEEIEKNRGVLYDNDVADACLRLFRKKGYFLKKS